MLGLFVSTVFLLLGSTEMYCKWWREILIWYAPLSLIVIANGSIGSTYSRVSRSDLAALLGLGLIMVTVGIMLLQRSYYNRP